MKGSPRKGTFLAPAALGSRGFSLPLILGHVDWFWNRYVTWVWPIRLNPKALVEGVLWSSSWGSLPWFIFFYCFSDKISCHPGWPQTWYTVKAVLEIIIHLTLPDKCYLYRREPTHQDPPIRTLEEHCERCPTSQQRILPVGWCSSEVAHLHKALRTACAVL